MKIALLGDICLNGKFDLKNNPNAKVYFSEVAQYLERFDYVIANLETPLTDRDFTFTCKGLHLKSSTVSIGLLKHLHVNVVGLANNHIFDYGRGGYKDTVEALQKNNIYFYGVEGKQFFLKDEGNKVALGGYCCFSANPSVCNSRGVNPLMPESVVEKLVKNDGNGYLNIVSIHWGDENIHYPRIDHVLTARSFADRVPVIVHGHHTHVVQGVEDYKSSTIAYSLGNFCTDDVFSTAVKDLKVIQKKPNKESFIMALEIENNKIIQYEVIPIFDNGNKIEMGDPSIKEAVSVYSNALKRSPEEYQKFRMKKMDDLSVSISKKKDFNWFARRLNYYFIGAVIKGMLSQNRYNKVMKIIQENS